MTIRKLAVMGALATTGVLLSTGEAEALPSDCRVTYATGHHPDAATMWCLSNWAPGDRAELRLICHNWAGGTTAEGWNANDITRRGEISTDRCTLNYPFISGYAIRKWNIA